MTDSETRIRDLEKQTSASWQRIDHLETQHNRIWDEVRRLNSQNRDDYRNLREAMQADKEELSALITGSKIAAAAQSGGTRAIAWGIGTLIGIGTVAAGIAAAISKMWK